VTAEEVRSPEEFAVAEAVLDPRPLLFGFRKELCSLSMAHKLSITRNREQAEAGCTVGYGKLSEPHGLAAVFEWCLGLSQVRCWCVHTVP
jgi:hypothetical protein